MRIAVNKIILFSTFLFLLGPVGTAKAFFHGMHPVAMFQDPCTSGSVKRGTVCANGTIYAGAFTDLNGTTKKIMLPPKNCTSPTVCSGSGDDISYPWGGTAGQDDTIAQNIPSSAADTLSLIHI